MKELYDLMRERMAFLESQAQTDERLWRMRELTLAMVKVQQLLLANIKKENDTIRSGEVRDDINCPKCGEHHIDKDEWAKRLHRKHQCEKCGHIWQPHEHYTFGI